MRLRVVILAAIATLSGTIGPGARGAAAQVVGEIIGPGAASYPIAVSPLREVGGRRDDAVVRFADVLDHDLELSGYFLVLDREAYIDDPQASPTTAGEIEFQNWSVIGALALVKGTLERTAAGVAIIEVSLFDVPARRVRVAKRYRAPLGQLPRVAHRFADEILRVLTRVRGPFESRIAFISTRAEGVKDLFVMTFDSAPRRLTADRSIVLSPSWSPDARGILFTSYRPGSPSLYMLDYQVNPGERGVRRRVTTQALSGGVWSPDGSLIATTVAVAGNPEIMLFRPDGTVARRLTRHPGIDVSPTWSPDGREIAFCSDRKGGPQIFAIEVASGNLRRVTFRGHYNTSPAWSPRRNEIAYAGRVGGRFQIFTVDARGGRGSRLTDDPGDNEDPAWSPNGRYLVYSSTNGGHAHLWLMDRHGTMRKQLTHGEGDDTSPAWSPRLK